MKGCLKRGTVDSMRNKEEPVQPGTFSAFSLRKGHGNLSLMFLLLISSYA